MTKRFKVGDVKIALIRNPDPQKTGWLVTRFRPKTGEYLSKQEALTFQKGEYLFTEVVGQEQLRQKKEVAEQVAALRPGSFATEVGDRAGSRFYRDHPYYARF